MSSSNLVSSFRRVTSIPHGAAHDSVVQALRDHDKGLTDLQTAIPLLKAQIDALKTASTSNTTTVIESGGGGGGSTPVGIGSVNNQSGITAYTTQTTDNGTLLILSDSSPVAVTLNSFVTPPFSFFTINWGTGAVTFSPQSPTTINYIGNLGAASMPLNQGYIGYLVYDGANWWAETIPVSPKTFVEVPNEFLISYDETTGLFSSAQPSFTNLSGQIDPATQMPTSGVVAGSYAAADITVDAEGLITAATSGMLSGTSGSLGGSAMTAGQTITTTVTISGATTAMVVAVSPAGIEPGAGFVFDGFVSAADTVTVRLTCVAAGTPVATSYNCRVIV
ncbi:MAG TPA: hypothetical protein VFW94_24310 [Candidatus Acidoferrales bacterium]|nr:hypothetical protein [Candidatus Acidoferrales bacterium]